MTQNKFYSRFTPKRFTLKTKHQQDPQNTVGKSSSTTQKWYRAFHNTKPTIYKAKAIEVEVGQPVIELPINCPQKKIIETRISKICQHRVHETTTKIASHAKKQENLIHTQEKKGIDRKLT